MLNKISETIAYAILFAAYAEIRPLLDLRISRAYASLRGYDHLLKL